MFTMYILFIFSRLHIYVLEIVVISIFILPDCTYSHLIGRCNPPAQRGGLGLCECNTTCCHIIDCDIYPQAAAEHALSGEIGEAAIRSANVEFADSHGGFVDHRGEVMDELSHSLIEEHVSLDNFFARPLKVQEYEWNIGLGFTQTFDPWSLFFQNKRVINRLANYRLLKATLHVKVVVNGTPLHFGRLLMSYTPLPVFDSLILTAPAFSTAVVNSQKPHIYINPANSQGGTLKLPFFCPYNMLDITLAQWNIMGRCDINLLADLKHANAGTDPVTINVFVWAENVELSGLTQQNPLGIVPQAASEYNGILSKPASAISRYAGVLKEIPSLSRYAMATELGAASIARMANFFGFCKPADAHPGYHMITSSPNMVNSDGRLNLAKLSVDSKQELTVDPAIAGLSSDDEMAIQSIATRETLIHEFLWRTSDSSETLLYNSIVDPCIIRPCSDWDSPVFMTSLAHVTFPFNYWRGSLKFRFQVVSCNFHKGRLKVVWDPLKCPTGASEYNTAFTQIIDISEQNDFSVIVGWGQNTPWRHHLERIQTAEYAFSPEDAFSAAAPISYDSANTHNIGNGVISVYVLNPIVTPNSTADNDLRVLVSLSACDDYEVAAPNYQTREFGFYAPPLSAFASDPPYTPLDLSNPFVASLSSIPEDGPLLDASITPQSAPEKLMNLDTPVQNMDNIYHMGPASNAQNIISKVHMGETIVSMRPLLKRFMFHEALVVKRVGGVTDRQTHIAWIRRNFPYYGGYVLTAPSTNNLVLATTPGNLYPSVTTLMNYMAPAYAGWRGSIRYMTDTSPVTFTGQSGVWFNAVKITFNEKLSLPERNDYDHAPATSETQGIMDYIRRVNPSNLHGWSPSVNPVQAIEVPYQVLHRFSPTRLLNEFSTTKDPFQSSWEFETWGAYGNSPRMIPKFVAAGEDFSLLFYIGAPRMYYRPLVPLA